METSQRNEYMDIKELFMCGYADMLIAKHSGAVLLEWFDFNPSMDKWSHAK